MPSCKAFITDDKVVIINCPECHRSTKVPLATIGKRHRCRVKCTCGNVFVAEVEYREKFRKQVAFPGFYEITRSTLSAMRNGARVHWESVAIDGKVPNCQIVDISPAGIGFLKKDKRLLNINDVIRIRFKLDNSAKTEITQECAVKFIKNDAVGCQMLSKNISLGFYLLS